MSPFLSVYPPAFPLPGHDIAGKEKFGNPSLCTLHCAVPCSMSYFFRKSQVLKIVVGILHSLLPSLWLVVLRELKTPVERSSACWTLKLAQRSETQMAMCEGKVCRPEEHWWEQGIRFPSPGKPISGSGIRHTSQVSVLTF